MENRANLDHLHQQHQQQLYATIQRKQPPVPPFSHNKGFDTMDRLKQDVCPYAANTFQQQVHRGMTGGGLTTTSNTTTLAGRCNTLGRVKNLEMTEYQKQKLLDEADTVKIKESKEYTLSLGRNHSRIRRKLYSESEEYDDTDTSGDNSSGGRGDANNTTSSSARTTTESTRSQEAANSQDFPGLRFTRQFHL